MLTSSNAYEPFRVYQLKPSRWVAAFLLVTPIVSIVGLMSVSVLPALVKTLAICACCLVSALTWRLHWPGARQAPTAIAVAADGRCEVQTTSGQWLSGQLHDAFVAPCLIILTLRRGLKRRAVTIPVDALGAERHRQLRAWTQLARRVNEHH